MCTPDWGNDGVQFKDNSVYARGSTNDVVQCVSADRLIGRRLRPCGGATEKP